MNSLTVVDIENLKFDLSCSNEILLDCGNDPDRNLSNDMQVFDIPYLLPAEHTSLYTKLQNNSKNF